MYCHKPKNNNSLYINIEQNGCFVAMIFGNMIHCGYQMQALNVSGLLDEKEKKALMSNDVKDSDFLEICTKIFKSMIIPLTPERIYISGKTIPQNSKRLLGVLSFQKAELFGPCMAKNYNPIIELIPNFMSKEAAITAMYRYYGWDYTCL